jgi:hypothetical protein
MIPKSGNRFSDKIMLKEKSKRADQKTARRRARAAAPRGANKITAAETAAVTTKGICMTGAGLVIAA